MHLKTSVQSNQRLPIHEWMAVVVIIFTFLLLTVISLLNYEKAITESEPVNYSPPLIDITVEGAVKFPGTYQVEKGTPILEVLGQAEPLPNADLKRFASDAKVVRKRKIVLRNSPALKR
jgi:hypothetical protein